MMPRVTNLNLQMYMRLPLSLIHIYFSDTKRYFITEAFNKEYTKFSLRRSRNKIPDYSIRHYDKSKVDLSEGYGMVEINPSFNSQFVFVRVIIKNGKCYVTRAMLSDTIICLLYTSPSPLVS